MRGPSRASTPSSRRGRGDNVASMAWNRHAIAQTQLQQHVASMAGRQKFNFHTGVDGVVDPALEDVELFSVVQSPNRAVEHEKRHEESAGEGRGRRVRELGRCIKKRPDMREHNAERDWSARRRRN